MAEVINYQKELDKIIKENTEKGTVPTLLLHSCCAPCSSYVLEYLSKYFKITVLYYNPNISPLDEYSKRIEEQKRFILEFPAINEIKFIDGVYEPQKFYDAVKGMEELPEGGERCRICCSMRINYTADFAKTNEFDYFTTTLSISPLKNAKMLNEEGKKAEEKYGVKYLPSDFKKKDGYKRSVELSKEYRLYRQDFCGCIYSKRKNEIS